MNFLVNESEQVIEQSIIQQGIMASPLAVDNYRAVWARDATIAGISGFLFQNNSITIAFIASIKSLAQYQAHNGLIPSNIKYSNRKQEPQISYGTLAGRVDATLWWLVGCGILIHNGLLNKKVYETKIEKALYLTDCWEYNNKNLIYTPTSGNWADEYITHGYTLYDNMLRYWAYKLHAHIFGNNVWHKKAKQIKKAITINFNMDAAHANTAMHQKAFAKVFAAKTKYMPAAFDSTGYQNIWDMAGNALALLFGMNTNVEGLKDFLNKLHQYFKHWMLPAFYPVIHKNSPEWLLLAQNHNYNFKNKPYHFHNGGCWPVFLGMLVCNLKNDVLANEIRNYFFSFILKHKKFYFTEYWSTNNLKPHGVNPLCFSAAGILFMNPQVNQQMLKQITL